MLLYTGSQGKYIYLFGSIISNDYYSLLQLYKGVTTLGDVTTNMVDHFGYYFLGTKVSTDLATLTQYQQLM